ncbi:xanthine dehydrogenase family protein subunit M [Ktedonosporobacter rubrisoli]|uniref:Xanthine dehydrogenase family protein subunit M n=1 Tax=Ktedonosporobacter rubrisoli TaxID=2509675 RepID=A0A4P6K5E1_KTERU|nr:xanthine dehydrogenase family protein subunit M [Ktedonosporobacter rubrisoli]QBD82756.1 xanthine dehydrogenase family protein subunit M [Ktedonosporobacter rubrisoli]
MKPPRFAYHDPATRQDVFTLLDIYADDAKVLAGGQSLIPLLNMRLSQPGHLIDINRVADLAYIHEAEGGLVIGALTRQRDLERSPLVRRLCPLVAEAIPFIGHAPIRSRGTLGGSLAHADPAAELPAVLLALQGSVQVEFSSGRRRIEARDFFLDQLQTALQPKELLTEVWLPALPPRSGSAFLEVSRRHGDFALVGVAAQITLRANGTISAAHLALTGVAPTPIHAQQAETLLREERPSEALFAAAAREVSIHLAPDTDLHASTEYRRSVAGVLVERTLRLAVERARQEGNR